MPTFSVVALSPIVARSTLAEHKIVRPEDGAVVAATDTVHSAGLKVHKYRPGDILSTAGLVVVDIDSLKLEI